MVKPFSRAAALSVSSTTRQPKADGGGILSVLPLGLLPFTPEQSLLHYPGPVRDRIDIPIRTRRYPCYEIFCPR